GCGCHSLSEATRIIVYSLQKHSALTVPLQARISKNQQPFSSHTHTRTHARTYTPCGNQGFTEDAVKKTPLPSSLQPAPHETSWMPHTHSHTTTTPHHTHT